MQETGAEVEISNLSVSYQRNRETVAALSGVSFRVEAGTTCAVIGPSGCGKSTLLYVLAGLIRPQDGQSLINGRETQPGRRETSLILQDYGLLPWKTVWHNTILGLVIRREAAAAIRAAGEQVLRQMGLWEMRHRYPAQLSGGQRQRVAIARSLAMRPDLLLMDEPFSSLDALTRESLQEALLDILQGGGLTVILVTHSIEEAAYLGRRIVVLTPHPGRVTAVLENPRAGDKHYRQTEQFFRLCRNLRRILEGVYHTGTNEYTARSASTRRNAGR
ncbi:ABC transporter ATP-binding protein [Desulfotomaculum copahuensis]|uniref:ABC transporter ATP-binding protein n=1 Tax=Desulfotomaculum copahuensis TaxID=1838280 RepID=A0A1B7LCB0_9FIRM|nr:ABC transporter ATP-binding protein [Desulfotomaculum copahuensis]OAT80300.1 ABC transporter ATP-binding protein [Desulfotomaculum copahuensis]